MTTAHEKTAVANPETPAAYALQWKGHMADHIGATYGPEPLAFLAASETELLLSGNRGTFRFPRAAVVKLGRGGLYPWCFSSVGIRHSIAGFPAELQFKPMGASVKAVLGELKSLGYPAR